MGMNRVPIDKSMTKEKAISQGGYYNTDGDWNNITLLDEYPGKIFRGRVEVLILKDGKLFMYRKENGDYRIPGGGFDKGVLNKDQAFIETKEESKMIIENIKYTGVTYVRKWEDLNKRVEGEIPYDGTYTEVYIADYKADYEGYIRKGLSDMELTKKGQFYELKEIENILKEPHKHALQNILNGIVTEMILNELYLRAHEFQNVLRGLHKTFDCYHCIQNRDIESDDGGYIFAEYYTQNQKDIEDVKAFVGYCNSEIKKANHNAYVEEPVSYKGHGFLFIKEKE